MSKVYIVLGMLMFVNGCSLVEPEVRYANGGCPKVQVIKVQLKVNKAGGLDKAERIKAFTALSYFTRSNTRVNALIDEINSSEK